MNQGNITTIIFDLGGVLINWNPRNLYRKIFKTELEITQFLDEVCTMDWNEQQDAGRSLEEATNILLERHPDPKLAAPIKAYYGRWPEMLGGAIEGTVEILKSLIEKKEYKIIALTNWSAETFPVAQAQFEFLQWFEYILVSGEVKLKKPDPKIYQMLLSDQGLKAEECIFIDDSARNIAAAKQLGIHGIHFSNPVQLKDTLQKKGISC